MPRREHVLRTLLVAALLPLCWLTMQVVHEAGHVLAAWMTGGTVTAVVLHPLAISRTDVSPNPHPLPVVWAGPLVGVIAPAAIWLVVAALRQPSTFLWQFFAGFCLIANGVYIGSGVVEPVGDAAELVDHGTSAWTLAAFGLVTIPAGFVLWNGLGPSFGFGKEPRPVSKRNAWFTATLLAIVVVAELVWFSLMGVR
ncbi:MAG: M50 family metallopeptidase [Planctomycetaceae bacterium]